MPTFASARPRTAHVVAIRRPGGAQVVAYQVRVDGGGPGNSAYFPAGRHGSAPAALSAALAVTRALGLPDLATQPGARHRLRSQTNNTGYAGIRFVWRPTKGGPETLCVFASWIEPTGRKKTSSYSVERWGLDGALDRAIARRTAHGAAAPDRTLLLRALQTEYRRRFY